MSEPMNLRTEGVVDELKGKAKSAVGEATGDDKTRAEGDYDQTVGKVKQGAANVMNKADDWMKEKTDD
jgi:uncharacterized protein YjbJ (UPF0337 family)